MFVSCSVLTSPSPSPYPLPLHMSSSCGANSPASSPCVYPCTSRPAPNLPVQQWAAFHLSPTSSSASFSSCSPDYRPTCIHLPHTSVLLYQLRSSIFPVNGTCVHGCVRVCEHVWLQWKGRVLWGAVQQPILRLQFLMISLWSLKTSYLNVPPSPLLSSMSILILKALGTNGTSGSIEPYLSGIKRGIFSGRVPSSAAVFTPGLRNYSQTGRKHSLTASSSQAKALLASLSASSLSAEALLLSSTLRHHRLLHEQRASSLPWPSCQSSSPAPTDTSSPCSPSPPSPPSLCSGQSPILNGCKKGGRESVNKDLNPSSPQWLREEDEDMIYFLQEFFFLLCLWPHFSMQSFHISMTRSSIL